MIDAKQPNEAGNQPAAKPTRTLPDMAVCRARRSGIAGLAFCLVSNPNSCKFVISFAKDYFCCHQKFEEIVARTEAADHA